MKWDDDDGDDDPGGEGGGVESTGPTNWSDD